MPVLILETVYAAVGNTYSGVTYNAAQLQIIMAVYVCRSVTYKRGKTDIQKIAKKTKLALFSQVNVWAEVGEGQTANAVVTPRMQAAERQ